MSTITDTHAATMHKLIDVVWNQRRLDRMAEVFDERVLMHYGGEDLTGIDQIRERLIAPFQAAFPDMQRTIEALVMDGHSVAMRFTASGIHAGDFGGKPATHAMLDYGVIGIFRMHEGRIAEVWAHSDFATRFAAL